MFTVLSLLRRRGRLHKHSLVVSALPIVNTVLLAKGRQISLVIPSSYPNAIFRFLVLVLNPCFRSSVDERHALELDYALIWRLNHLRADNWRQFLTFRSLNIKRKNLH